MAGSLNHIVNSDGTFSMNCIDNLGDAGEALEECFDIILFLAGGDTEKVRMACKALKYSDPWEDEYGDDPKEPMCSKHVKVPLKKAECGSKGEIERLREAMRWASESLAAYNDGGCETNIKDAKRILDETLFEPKCGKNQ